MVAGGHNASTAAVQVEAYKRPTFAVSIEAPAESPRLGDEVVVPAITHPAAAAALDIPTITDAGLREALETRLL